MSEATEESFEDWQGRRDRMRHERIPGPVKIEEVPGESFEDWYTRYNRAKYRKKDTDPEELYRFLYNSPYSSAEEKEEVAREALEQFGIDVRQGEWPTEGA